MLESTPTWPASNYLHIVHLLEGTTSVAPQLNSITDIIFELKAKLAKIKTEVKKIKKQLSIIHISLFNEIRHSGNSSLSTSAPFHHKYYFQNLKNKNLYLLHDIKIQKEVGEKPTEKSSKKVNKEEEDGV